MSAPVVVSVTLAAVPVPLPLVLMLPIVSAPVGRVMLTAPPAPFAWPVSMVVVPLTAFWASNVTAPPLVTMPSEPAVTTPKSVTAWPVVSMLIAPEAVSSAPLWPSASALPFFRLTAEVPTVPMASIMLVAPVKLTVIAPLTSRLPVVIAPVWLSVAPPVPLKVALPAVMPAMLRLSDPLSMAKLPAPVFADTEATLLARPLMSALPPAVVRLSAPPNRPRDAARPPACEIVPLAVVVPAARLIAPVVPPSMRPSMTRLRPADRLTAWLDAGCSVWPTPPVEPSVRSLVAPVVVIDIPPVVAVIDGSVRAVAVVSDNDPTVVALRFEIAFDALLSVTAPAFEIVSVPAVTAPVCVSAPVPAATVSVPVPMFVAPSAKPLSSRTLTLPVVVVAAKLSRALPTLVTSMAPAAVTESADAVTAPVDSPPPLRVRLTLAAVPPVAPRVLIVPIEGAVPFAASTKNASSKTVDRGAVRVTVCRLTVTAPPTALFRPVSIDSVSTALAPVRLTAPPLVVIDTCPAMRLVLATRVIAPPSVSSVSERVEVSPRSTVPSAKPASARKDAEPPRVGPASESIGWPGLKPKDVSDTDVTLLLWVDRLIAPFALATVSAPAVIAPVWVIC